MNYADIKYIEADTAIFDTISGDINIRGNVKLKRGSSITGSINYKEMNQENKYGTKIL